MSKKSKAGTYRARTNQRGSKRNKLWYRSYRTRMRQGLEHCRHCSGVAERRETPPRVAVPGVCAAYVREEGKCAAPRETELV